ncbi:MAG TPA: PQQ-dependent sugar dehydrogenase [Ferrovibrio sp.]|uniref:PQQ-dependent sugar dehydrogenase n=1 Tax=Ferrovibrio sp. TaxID=1917215 RepID=UPI002B4B8AAF|nr:PQQ-dependent sugar dehydrogenase [Ferrovibrio sp.]HLT77064.1 PQQ-dependent sugar dehydrogenase [Ferrovibrio sp.]
MRTSLQLMITGLLAGLLARGGPGLAQDVETRSSEAGLLRVVTVAKGLENPWALQFLPDGRMLVTERPGRIRIVARDGSLSAPLANVPEVFASGQGGLLDLHLDPDFASSRRLYFSYAEPGEGGAGTAMASARFAETRLEDVTVIFRQQPKMSGGNHFGSRIVVDRGGRLWLGMGERFRFDPAQDLRTHLGKVVRLEKDGSVPPDNPFVGRGDALPEIWSYGHRNIQGMALHPATGQVWLHEHGARGGDEINIPEAGRNYGWPVIAYGVHYSGQKIGIGTEAPGMEQPLLHWTPSIAPAGMAFYTGDRIPAWKGNLFAGSLVFRSIQRVVLDGTRVVAQERIELGSNIRDVRDGPDGYLYAVTDSSNGRILRLEPGG